MVDQEESTALTNLGAPEGLVKMLGAGSGGVRGQVLLR